MTNLFSLVMAAGAGKRMGCPELQKACLEAAGRPVILRALEAYEAAGVGHHILVVGHHADQVMATVQPHHENATYAYQKEPLGTGHAAKCGLRVLQDAGYEGALLLVAGDKIVQAQAIARLVAEFRAQKCDLALLTAPKEGNADLGRVVRDAQGRPVAIVEVSEIKRAHAVDQIAQLLDEGAGEVSSAAVLSILQDYFPNPEKAKKAMGALYVAAQASPSLARDNLLALLRVLQEGAYLSCRLEGGQARVPLAEVEELAQEVNQSIYLFRTAVLSAALEMLERDNAQGEEFLTDVVAILASQEQADGSPTYRLAAVPVANAEEILTFNTPEQLAAVEEVLRRQAETAPETE